MTFDTVLVANRGEIACRVIRTARRMGLRTVAVFSDADRDAAHVALADVAYRLGPASALRSYLAVERVIEAARATGAGAVHPGYGFLSENPALVEACEAAGIVFVGPPADAIRAMGHKHAAKRLMEAAGVPVVPGYHGEDQSDAVIHEQACTIGFPVLVKAVAGGGGKGMRRVDRESDLAAALAGARREARASFGDERVLVERYVACPRHVEIQVFADAHGNVVHLFERDCSLQRRHQKVIEEAPAPGMPPEMRTAMGEAAVAAARAIGYRGAGTVEFIADASDGLAADRFWFMEMNTRLQVEHPVTELVTGQDLVEWQLRVAAGEPLPCNQASVGIDGHAIEARIYAEDPARGFLPATGRLRHVAFPSATGVRVDTGVRTGDTITPFYDPMIAKVIAHGPTREAARQRLRRALGEVEVAGCVTNAPFLARLLAHPEFVAGRPDTGLIDREVDALTAPTQAPPEVAIAAALHAVGALAQADDDPWPGDPWTRLRGWRAFGGARQFVHLEIGGEAVEVPVTFDRVSTMAAGLPHGATATLRVELGGVTHLVRVAGRDGDRITLDVDGRVGRLTLVEAPGVVHVIADGRTHDVALPDRLTDDDDADAAPDRIEAPLPGRVTAVAAEAGRAVTRGDTLAVLEAMKMELTVESPRDGVVESVAVAVGDQVEAGATLAVLVPRESTR
ncbi:MAG: acetyl/propionyl/methylcrotonyl-CoA carboxylase subunit alpha [Ectothiorhodospiraceae bacterium]|nr:acetyl/propionyl/methylcrotonyl-CoA carboxylase subunit alpha [Ectothiorhodospiraceae bacterium]